MKIEFTGTWPEIRTDIQKFSIDHLNMKFSVNTTELKAQEAIPTVPEPSPLNGKDVDPPPPPAKKGGKVAKSKLTHAEIYPKEEKTKAADVEPSSVPASTSQPHPSTSADLSPADCVSALEKVYNAFGMEKSIEILSRFGVKRARELKPNMYRGFIDLCQQTAR